MSSAIQPVVDAAMALLPAWVPYAQGVLAFVVAFVLQAVATGAAVRVSSGPLRALPADAHWSERARALWPVRSAVGLSQVVGAAVLAIPVGVTTARGDGAGLFGALGLGFVGWLGGAAVGARSARRWAGIPRRGPIAAVRGMLAALLGVYGHVLGWGILAVAMPSTFDRRALGFGLVAAGLLAASLTGWNLGFARALRLLDAPDERLRRVVAGVMGAAPLDALYVLPSAVANAWAFPTARTMMFSSRILDVLDDAQLGAVAAHEAAHIAEPPSIRLVRAGVPALFSLVVYVHPIVGTFGVGGLVVLAALVVVGLMALGSVRLRMEARADEAAHGQEGDPGVYARALEAIYAANRMPAVVKRPRSHPSLYDRMIAAGVTPSWPRPAPPSNARGWLGGAVACGIVGVGLGGLGAVYGGLRAGAGPGPAGDAASVVGIAVAGPNPADFSALAVSAHTQGADDAAIAFDQAAMVLAPRDPLAPAHLARVYAAKGDCGSAVHALRVASGLAADAEVEHDGEEVPDRVRERLDDAAEAVNACLGAPDPSVSVGAGGPAEGWEPSAGPLDPSVGPVDPAARPGDPAGRPGDPAARPAAP